ncbi:glutathione S-transferase family protein [Vulgatibacter incomptus]|uniref:Glutathione S-transferase n=1 Tax=Vulgatibacter incomptus TaxID=1391653 RepID=A0A0K1PGI9_9BACT|nr:glutathione S-transferase family protein [Vulgatibacter incomptus]AKU92536.1 hypothetical protein AKJ08_2923 [Vulgatibacter incomptus]
MTESALRLYTFSPAFGLPTAGPFGLKLEVCLRMLDVPYERVVADNSRKGPKRKSPWIEDGGVRLGDTELILRYLEQRYGKVLDRGLDPDQRSRAHVLRKMLEEHFHQVFEYELLVRDDGWAAMKRHLSAAIPPLALAVAGPIIRRGFRRHLFERGIARHSADEIEALGKADIDALATWLGDREWFVADEPTKADATALGLLAVTVRSGLPGPVCTYARSKPNLVRFVDRGLARFFPELPAQA